MLKKNILITGYAPFGEHATNASWEAVKLIREDAIPGSNIFIQEIPVSYKYVNEHIAKLWKKYKPNFVLHVGVSKGADCLELESEANRTGYVMKDVDGQSPSPGEVCDSKSGPDILRPELDVCRISEQLNGENSPYTYKTSCDAGRYLCEYTFYTSLNIDNGKVLLTHVPALNDPYSAQELAEALIKITYAALQQLKTNTSATKKFDVCCNKT